MGRCRFVQPETVRLSLSDGDWIEVKKRLSVGEQREAFAAVVGEVNTEGWRRPNLKMMGIAQVALYVVDWSFTDANDKRVPVSAAAIAQLSTRDFDEIDAAIAAHIEAMEAADSERKKSQDGESASVATSPSVVS